MRAKTIIGIALVLGVFLYFWNAPWMSHVDDVTRWLRHYLPLLYPVLSWCLSILMLPGIWVMKHIWSGFFAIGGHETSLLRVLLEAFGWICGAVISYVFWVILLSRFFKFIGLWNPFGWRSHEGRPSFLRLMVRFHDWVESNLHFGRHATGGFASLFEVLSNEFHLGDVFLGRPLLPFPLWGGLLRPIGIPTERHMVTIAGTGSGKSTGALIPNLCLHQGNILVIDPKGELAAITAKRRGQGGGGVHGMGDDVHVLDPFEIVPGFRTSSYNVFEEMEKVAQTDINQPVSYASTIAQALCPTVTQKDPYWENAARTFITGLVLYVFQGPPEQRNLVRVRELIMEGDKETFARLPEGKHDDGDAFDALLMMMKSCPEGPYRHVIVGAANTLSRISHNQRGGVLSMAMEHTSFLDVPQIRAVSQRSDFLLEDLKNKNISVYLCLPLNKVTGIEQRWLRMFVMLTVDMFVRITKRPRYPVLLAIDEFPALGFLEGIDTVAPQLRSCGVRLWVAAQSIDQLQAVYPKTWIGFIGNAAAVQFMGNTDPPTVAWLTERLGRHVVGSGPGKLKWVGPERAVRDAEQVGRMLASRRQTQIIWRGSERPMALRITPYWEYMPWWYYSRDRRFPEKWKRWIWRWGRDPVAGPEPQPLSEPPSARPIPAPREEPAEKLLSQYFQSEPNIGQVGRGSGAKKTGGDAADKARGEGSLMMKDMPAALARFLAKQPEIGPDDVVPGTYKTWADVVSRKMGEDAATVLNVPPAKPAPKRIPKDAAKSVEATPAPKTADKGAALAELEGMIGLDSVKERVRATAATLKLQKVRAGRGMPSYNPTQHLVFTGNPGTGKTTVARIVGRIYQEMGLLQSGHMVETDRSKLIGFHVGDSTKFTQAVIESALDGVLFIDEAYSVVAGGYEKDVGVTEVVPTLVKAMEDYRDRLVVIVAGYKLEMEKFINSNPGLKARFKTVIDFPDYDASELFRIFVHTGQRAGIRLSREAHIAVRNLMEGIDTGKKGFGNGRAVRNLFDECFARQALRLERDGDVDPTIFETDDIPKTVSEVKFDSSGAA